MHGLPYINQSNFAAANKEAQRIIEANITAGIPAKKEAEFDKHIAESIARLEADGGVKTVDNGIADYN